MSKRNGGTRLGTYTRRPTGAVVVVEPPPVLDVEQAAALVGVSVETFLTLGVPYVSVGGGSARVRRRYLRESLLHHLKAAERPADRGQR